MHMLTETLGKTKSGKSLRLLSAAALVLTVPNLTSYANAETPLSEPGIWFSQNPYIQVAVIGHHTLVDFSLNDPDGNQVSCLGIVQISRDETALVDTPFSGQMRHGDPDGKANEYCPHDLNVTIEIGAVNDAGKRHVSVNLPIGSFDALADQYGNFGDTQSMPTLPERFDVLGISTGDSRKKAEGILLDERGFQPFIQAGLQETRYHNFGLSQLRDRRNGPIRDALTQVEHPVTVAYYSPAEIEGDPSRMRRWNFDHIGILYVGDTVTAIGRRQSVDAASHDAILASLQQKYGKQTNFYDGQSEEDALLEGISFFDMEGRHFDDAASYLDQSRCDAWHIVQPLGFEAAKGELAIAASKFDEIRTPRVSNCGVTAQYRLYQDHMVVAIENYLLYQALLFAKLQSQLDAALADAYQALAPREAKPAIVPDL